MERGMTDHTPSDHDTTGTSALTTRAADHSGYQRKRARTRRTLRRAGMEVLAARGPDGTTIGAVAKQAKVAPGTFYNHFPTLHDLVTAVVDELATGVEIGRDLLTQIEHDPAGRVLIGTRQLLSLTSDDPIAARAFVSLLASVPELRVRVRAIVRSAIVDGVAVGRFSPRNPNVTTDALLGAVVQWMRSRLADEAGPAEEPEQLRAALQIAGLAEGDIDDVLRRVAVSAR
jgi:AcrR family transcriptional regulator